MLDFRMETFLAVCRHLNYTRAAEELNITQPAVTQHIQHLQAHYGARLLDYRDKRLSLTPEGEALRRAAVTMLHDEQKLPDVVLLLQLFQPLTGDIVGTCLLRFRLHKGDG